VQTIKVYLKGKKAAGEEKQQESKQQIWPWFSGYIYILLFTSLHRMEGGILYTMK
jgi:hypothetical protein